MDKKMIEPYEPKTVSRFEIDPKTVRSLYK